MRILAFVVAILLTFSCGGQSASTGRPAAGEHNSNGPTEQNYAPDEVLVRFKKGTNDETRETLLKRLNLKVIKTFRTPRLYLLRITDGSTVPGKTDQLNALSAVMYAEPNFRYSTRKVVP